MKSQRCDHVISEVRARMYYQSRQADSETRLGTAQLQAETLAGSWRLETRLETGVESRPETETDWSDCGEALVQAEPGESPRGSNVL